MASESCGKVQQQVDVCKSCDAQCIQALAAAMEEEKKLNTDVICCSSSCCKDNSSSSRSSPSHQYSNILPSCACIIGCTHDSCMPSACSQDETKITASDPRHEYNSSSSAAPAARSISLPETKEVVHVIHGEDEDEIDGAGCITPTSQEHCIPDRAAVCPPPPYKKRCISVKHAVSIIDPFDGGDAARQDNTNNNNNNNTSGPSFFRPPSDLHTYPEAIRALFKG